MEHPSEFATRVTLLGRLRAAPDDPAAWSEFVALVWRQDLRLVPRLGTPGVRRPGRDPGGLPHLSVRMHEFRYDPSRSFRAWLKTLTHHAWQDYLEKQRRPGRGSGSESVMERLAAVEAQDDLARGWPRPSIRSCSKEAAARVRLRVEPRTWDAFRLLAIEGRSGAEAAQQLRMKVATVFVARSKVQRMLRQEVSRLDRV